MKHKLKLREKQDLAELMARHLEMPAQEVLEFMFNDDDRILVCRDYYSDCPGYRGTIVWVIGGDSCYQTCFATKDEGGWYIKYEINENQFTPWLENGKKWTDKNMNNLMRMYIMKGGI